MEQEYVRSRLDDVYWDKRSYNKHGDIVHLGWSICFAETEEEGWKLALEWVKERERQIKDVEEEIDWLTDRAPVYSEAANAKKQRILARLQSALADLRKGMRDAR